jgi:hypothetical protein
MPNGSRRKWTTQKAQETTNQPASVIANLKDFRSVFAAAWARVSPRPLCADDGCRMPWMRIWVGGRRGGVRRRGGGREKGGGGEPSSSAHLALDDEVHDGDQAAAAVEHVHEHEHVVLHAVPAASGVTQHPVRLHPVRAVTAPRDDGQRGVQDERQPDVPSSEESRKEQLVGGAHEQPSPCATEGERMRD